MFLCPLSKPLNSRTSVNSLVNLNFHFVVVVTVVVVVVVVGITCIEYFLSVLISSFVNIFKHLWKWFEFMHYSFLVNNTCVSTLPLYASASHRGKGCPPPPHYLTNFFEPALPPSPCTKQQFHKFLKIFDKFKIDIQVPCNIPMES